MTDFRLETRYGLGPSTNIFSTPLPNGTLFPEHLPVGDARADVFLKEFDRIRNKPWTECTLLDLGCNEGTACFTLAQTGARVLGIEGREDAVARGRYVRDALGFSNVDFLHGDVLDDALWSQVDAVFAAGILYHLDDPFSLLELIADHTRQYVYFCTHCAPHGEQAARDSGLGERISNPGVAHFHELEVGTVEYSETRDINEVHAGGARRHPRSGIGNTKSVWITANGLIESMTRLGFPFHELLVVRRDLRHRYSFFKQLPTSASIKPVAFSQPLPPRTRINDSARAARQLDVDYLCRTRPGVVVVGGAARLRAVRQTLLDSGVGIASIVDLGNRNTCNEERLATLHEIAHERGPLHIVIAVEKIEELYNQLTLARCASYIFTSFAL